MISVSDDSSFIIRLKYQLIFGIDKNWTLDLLYNYKKFYQLN